MIDIFQFKRHIFGLTEQVAFISEEKEDVVAESLHQMKKDMKKQKLMYD